MQKCTVQIEVIEEMSFFKMLLFAAREYLCKYNQALFNCKPLNYYYSNQCKECEIENTPFGLDRSMNRSV